MQARPNLDRRPEKQDLEAVLQFVGELERGFNAHDADVFNASFAADILWGNPNGGVLQGFDELHAVHRGFFAGPLAQARSRYALESVTFPHPDVAAAFVQRVTLGADGEPQPWGSGDDRLLRELALYVLVKREGRWWLAAGANTPVVRDPQAVG